MNVITSNALLARRLVTYARRVDTLELTPTERPLAEKDTDAYVVPVERMEWLLDGLDRPRTWLPVIAYGRAAGLRGAFLTGCKDYLREPWTPEELTIRISRISEPSSFATAWGTVRLSTASAATERGIVELTIQEYRILRTLLMQIGQAVPRDVLFYALWGRTGEGSRAVDVHVSSLRRKLRAIALPGARGRLIGSARGLGYFVPTKGC